MGDLLLSVRPVQFNEWCERSQVIMTGKVNKNHQQQNNHGNRGRQSEGATRPGVRHAEDSMHQKLDDRYSTTSSSSEINQIEDFSQSVDVSTSGRGFLDSSSFTQSVTVLPSASDGRYSIYTGTSTGAHKRSTSYGDYGGNAHDSFLESLKFGHNIGNPDLRGSRFELDSESSMRRKSSGSSSRKHKQIVESDRHSASSGTHSEKCQCGKYHCHRFKTQSVNMSKFTSPRIATALNERKSQEIISANENHGILRNIFWNAQLNFCEYKHGMKPVSFPTLWPADGTMAALLHDGIEELGLRGALWELCHLIMVDGPVSALKALLDKNIIRVDCQFDGDAGLLHLACLLRNMEAVQVVTQYGVSNKIKDKSGKLADNVCFCPRIRKQLPAKYLQSTAFLVDRNKTIHTLVPGIQDKDSIFKLATNPRCLYEIQKKLQVFDFQVNKERNKYGDCLIHVACRAGLCQLPLVMSLVKLQGADVNLCNTDGMTPLMIVAEAGDSHLCDTLMCLFGANPSKQNLKDGKTALHYAVLQNHVNVVSCLMKRGADMNVTDNDHCRPDDLLVRRTKSEDCQQIIRLHRTQRMLNLCDRVKNDTIYPIDVRASDVTDVDTDGYTLVMIAAMHDRVQNLDALLTCSAATVNAQHGQTGLTALGMAAKAGNEDCCDILLRHGACASILDMKGYMALHHAVLNNHEQVVNVFIRRFPEAYMGLYLALRLCRKSSIHDKITQAWERRQEEIIAPLLRICAMDGNAEKLFCQLEEGDNVNSKNNLNSQPALFVAVENSHVEVTQLLIEKGADVRKRDLRTGNTVLHIVAQTGHVDTGKYLLDFYNCPHRPRKLCRCKHRLDINAINNDKKTALQIAAAKGFISLTKMLIEHGATTALLNQRGTLFTTSEFEGARILIEGVRNEHTHAIMKLIADKSKRATIELVQKFVTRFDHNLRDKHGNTPLMVACKLGREEVVRFLLQSAVYANQIGNDESSDHSDTDSGVTDLPPWRSHMEPPLLNPEEALKSVEKSGEYIVDNLPLGASYDLTRSLNPSDLLNTLPGPGFGERGGNRLQSYLTDISRPKGLYIYHDCIVSHVCAVNLYDGNTPLHHAIGKADSVAIPCALIEADNVVVNMQNDGGLTALHLACKLGRKKILEKLLSVKGVDTSLLTLTGHLPEELTKNKTLIKMVLAARKLVTVPRRSTRPGSWNEVGSLTESLPSIPSTAGGSTINFDKVNDIYQNMKVDRAKARTESQDKDS